MKAFITLFAVLFLLAPASANAQTCTGQNCGVTSDGTTCSCFDCINRGPGSVPPVCATFPEPQMCPIRLPGVPTGTQTPTIPNGTITNCCFNPTTPQLTAACTAIGAQGDGKLHSPCGVALSPTCTAVHPLSGDNVPILVPCPAPLVPACYTGPTACPAGSWPQGCQSPFTCIHTETLSSDGWVVRGTCELPNGAQPTPTPIPRKANMMLFGVLLVIGVAVTGAATRKRRTA